MDLDTQVVLLPQDVFAHAPNALLTTGGGDWAAPYGTAYLTVRLPEGEHIYAFYQTAPDHALRLYVNGQLHHMAIR